MYYVYLHKLYDGTVFYVGKGKGKRAWSRHNRNLHWQRTVAKNRWFVEIVETDLQEWYAVEREVELIYYYGLRRTGDGPLVNLVYRTATKKNFHFSPDVRCTISAKARGVNNGNAIKQECTFFNMRTGELFKGAPSTFEQVYNLCALDIVHGKVSTLRGWYVVEFGIPKTLPADFSIYLFKHGTTGQEFEGTRQEFQRVTGCNVKNVFNSARTGEKSWGVVRKIRGPLYHSAA